MNPLDCEQLLGDIKEVLAADGGSSFALLGHNAFTYDLLSFFYGCGVQQRLLGVYSASGGPDIGYLPHRAFSDLAADAPAVVVVASDESKERILLEAMPFLAVSTTVLLGGYGHFAFQDPALDAMVQDALVPSLANGYPNTLIHLYQCLQNAARLGLEGVVAEFGMFKGGTTMMLSKFIERLGRSWKVIGFDTFAGFPPRRSALDMYNHPGCVFRDESSVRHYLEGRNVEIVSGDVVDTASRLCHEDLVLAFVDTDNYSSATAVLDVVQSRVLVGGAIVFDHFTGRDRFRYTLGERLAASRLLDDRRYFNLHDTGVFLRQC